MKKKHGKLYSKGRELGHAGVHKFAEGRPTDKCQRNALCAGHLKGTLERRKEYKF